MVVHSDHVASVDYEEYLTGLANNLRVQVPKKIPQSFDRPLLTPCLGHMAVWVTHVVWDDASIVFAVEYGGNIEASAGS